MRHELGLSRFASIILQELCGLFVQGRFASSGTMNTGNTDWGPFY